ncbi:hypothetical protein C8Q80DRAFT_875150 [Daedaleopsis nitida]|nr:hypothetical protein C8Q80DRAFT_875150 [Daedaleopsis nitida]
MAKLIRQAPLQRLLADGCFLPEQLVSQYGSQHICIVQRRLPVQDFCQVHVHRGVVVVEAKTGGYSQPSNALAYGLCSSYLICAHRCSLAQCRLSSTLQQMPLSQPSEPHSSVMHAC